MNSRMYDPLTGRMLSTDNYVNGQSATQAFNRYSYAGNNPLKYTDPTGDYMAIAFYAVGMAAELLSNAINGSGSFMQANENVNATKDGMSNSVMVHNQVDNNTTVSYGLDPFALGIGLRYTRRDGDMAYSASMGIGLTSGPYVSGGISYNPSWGGSIGLGAGYGSNHYGYGGSVSYSGYGAGYYQTQYLNGVGPDGLPNRQTVGGASLFVPGGSFRIENDFLALKTENGRLKLSGKDRWRSNAVELTVGDFVVGTRLYNNDPETECPTCFDLNGTDRRGNLNTNGYGRWDNGQVYEAPLWVGYNFGTHVERVGYSAPWVQDRTQNAVHRNGFMGTAIGHAHFFANYENFQYGPFLYTGYNNPYSLWGR